MQGKRRVTKPGKPGRSIEEVMVQRRLNSTDPLSLPNVGSKRAIGGQQGILSASMSDAELLRGGNGARNKKAVHFNSSMTGSLTSEQLAALEEEQRQLEMENKLSSVEPLKEHCRDLQNRCSTLEMQLQGTMKVMQRELKKAKDKAAENLEVQKVMWMKDMDQILQAKAKEGAYNMSASALMKSKNSGPPPLVAEETTISKINSHMTELDVKVVQLKEIFRHGDPMVERKKAVTQINACVRGWLQRLRYAAYQRGQREWKWLRCRQIVWLLDMNLGLQSKLDAGVQKLRLMHNVSFIYQVFVKWLHLTRQALPVRRAMYKAAMDKALAKDRALMLKIWEAFKSVTVGGKSTKQANEKRRVLIDAIREELSAALKAKGEIGVVPDEDVERVLYRRVLKSFLEAKRMLMMKNVLLNGFWKNVKMSRRNMAVAVDHNLQVDAGRIFYAWSDWVYMVGAGLDRKRWNQPRQYEIHYNQKRLDNFSRLRLKRYVFFPWKEFYIMQSLVRRMLQRQMARFVKQNFLAWREEAKKLRALRIKAVDSWRGYGRLLCLGPFQGWASYVKGVKNVNNERQRIVSSYLRWKWRQRIVIIMKRWRHQALYGRIDGLYTRQMLISSLNEQKIMSAGLEKMLSSQTVEVDECRDLADREIQKRQLLETRLKESQEDTVKNKSYAHHAEQEMKRLEGIIESMALLNPRQIEHLKKLQPKFQFKHRKVNIPRDDDDDLGLEGEEDGLGTPRGGSSLLGGDSEGPVCSTCNQPLPKGQSRVDNEQRALEEQLAVQNASAGGDGSGSGSVPAPGSAGVGAGAGAGSRPGSSPVVVPIGPGPLPGMEQGGDKARSGAGSPLMQQQQVQSPGTPAAKPDSGAGGPREPSMGSLSNSWLHGAADSAGALTFSHSLQGSLGPEQQLNIVSNEDMVLLDRVKWMLKRFSMPKRNDGVVAYVIPGEETRHVVEIPPEKPPTPEKKEEDEDSDDEEELRRKKNRGSIEDEMEVTKAKPKSPAKPKLMTAISWTPGKLVIPSRDGILPVSTEKAGREVTQAFAQEDIPAGAQAGDMITPGSVVLGADGKPDTLLPGDPVHEPAGIDAEDTAARMLLGMMNFLEEGDVTTFAPEDRRDWTTEVLHSVEDMKARETAAAAFDATFANGEGSVTTMVDEDGNPVEVALPADHPTHSHAKHLSSSKRAAAVASEVIGGAKSWRNALLYLRTMHPGAGNYSGVGVELDAAESQLYKRIVDMRSLLGEVVQRQSQKLEMKLDYSRQQATHRERLILAAKARAEAQEAEQAAREAAELAEKERIRAEEEAKMAAMRAARAARKLETGVSDSEDEDDEDDEDDAIDLVNPYAAMLNPNDFGGEDEEEVPDDELDEHEEAM